MGKQKFHLDDNVKIISGCKALVGKCGYIADCHYMNGHIVYYVADFKTNKVIGTFYSSNLEKLNEITITPENFDIIASYCVNKNIRGWFVNDEGAWMCVTHEDFGVKYDGDYITNGVTIYKDGKTSIGGKIVRFIPESTFEYTSVDIIKSVQEEYKAEQKKQSIVSKQLEVSIDEARKWYNKGGDLKKLALTLYSEQELDVFPLTWDEYCKTTYEKELFFISQTGIKKECEFGKQLNPNAKNSLPTEKLARTCSAYMQLVSLYWAWYGSWEPGFLKKNEYFYNIKYNVYDDKIDIDYWCSRSVKNPNHLFLFPNKKDATKFLSTFKDLFEEAKYVI